MADYLINGDSLSITIVTESHAYLWIASMQYDKGLFKKVEI
ncbi:hypothetical protein [Desemzia sp. FAM 23989]